ncbi:dual specificity protein phosphatase family protein [Tardiphaga robiniae]|uniref:Dual specificity protein phosphatase family protein n=1 Tax=Tardiphaga robiniae TaxID=943830 RepID=A0A7G6U1B4_9BRAD|nr:dual specificity protein phosphatase family protein [Tardiphaga robiniae]QND72796.1 dual specificity protein phosphatase family protein [Tardiphaga robiniae]
MKDTAIIWLKRFGRTVGVVALLTGAWAGYLRLSGNFHPIEEGVIYRSAQLSGSQFAERIRENGIKTIVNLRGNNTGRSWYDDEIRASEATGVRHIDYPINSGRELTDDQVAELTNILSSAARPVLIHCEAGSDRTGLTSALYELLVAKRSFAEASAQLSFRYGHFPWLGSRTVAMDRTFERVAAKLKTASGSD